MTAWGIRQQHVKPVDRALLKAMQSSQGISCTDQCLAGKLALRLWEESSKRTCICICTELILAAGICRI
eukprot:scaffold210081_cov19-Prasinocladus_malaysianus.AAC.1